MVSNDFFFNLLSTAHTSRSTNNLESAKYLFNYGFISKFALKASLVVRRLVNHRCLATRITSQSLRPITHTKLTPPGIFVYFEVNCARVTPRQRPSFQVSDWLVWQLRDCV